MMCPEEDYSTVVETLAIDDILKLIIRVGIEETKSHKLIALITVQIVLCSPSIQQLPPISNSQFKRILHKISKLKSGVPFP